MGSRYYSGVPSMSDQLTPLMAASVKNNLKNARKSHGVAAYSTVFLLSLPVLPLWTGMMIVGETLRLMFTRHSKIARREQLVFNIQFAFVGFAIGSLFYMFLYFISGTFRFIFDSFMGLIF